SVLAGTPPREVPDDPALVVRAHLLPPGRVVRRAVRRIDAGCRVHSVRPALFVRDRRVGGADGHREEAHQPGHHRRRTDSGEHPSLPHRPSGPPLLTILTIYLYE